MDFMIGPFLNKQEINNLPKSLLHHLQPLCSGCTRWNKYNQKEEAWGSDLKFIIVLWKSTSLLYP